MIRNLLRSERSIETARVVTFTKAVGTTPVTAGGNASSSSTYTSPPPSSIDLIFMAHADRPISPYAEPSVRVDYIQQLSPSASPTNSSSDNGNSSTSSSSWTNTQHQSTTTPLQTAAMAGGWQLADLPWFDNPFSLFPSSPSSSTGTAATTSTASAGGGHNQQQQQQRRRFMVNSSNQTFLGWWTYPYFLCSSRRWLITYSIPVHQQQQAKIGDRSYYLFLSINQFAIYNLQLIGWTDC